MATEGEQTDSRSVDEKIGDFLFGPEEIEQAAEEEALEPAPETDEVEPVEEGEESEASDEDSEETEESDDDIVEVEFDGEVLEAPRKIAEALMRQSDYTRKTQEVAEQRKLIETRQGEIENLQKQYEFAQQVQPDMLKVQQLDAQIEEAGKYLKDNLDNLSDKDIMKIRMAIDETRQEREQLVSGLQSKTQEFQQAQEQSRQELLKKGTEVLRSRIPNWGEKHQKAVRDFALNSGYTEQELNNLIDPRHAEVLWKASEYDRLKSGATPAVQKVSGAPTIKPKSRNPMPKETGDKLNLRKALKSPKKSDKDKANLLGHHIANRFGM